MLSVAALLVFQGATITVDFSKSLGPVNPFVHGNNLVAYQKNGYGDTSTFATNEGEGMWDPTKKQPVLGMVALAKQAGLTIARWPGGCATHLYDWKRSIGPIESRPDQLFGLPEYLATCRALGAEPLITVAEYFGSPQEAADLVEYLNAPNDGKHPWAAKRAADGHPGSWHVKWFEYGNESDHGPHRNNDDMGKVAPAYTADQYGALYIAYRKAMREVDPSIQLGAVVATGLQGLDGWPTKVATKIGSAMDYAIFHSYLPSVNDGTSANPNVIQNALAGEDQIQNYLDSFRAMVAKATGGPKAGSNSTPVAVTEFNGGFVQDKPVPFRHCLGNALVVADMIHVWMRPQNGIAFANFWEFPNEYWGMVRGNANRGETLVPRPQFYAVQLFAQHFGAELLQSKVACPSYDTKGDAAIGIEPHVGAGAKATDLESVFVTPAWQITPVKSVGQTTEKGVLRVDFKNPGDLNYYHAVVEAKVLPSTSYRVTGWVKTEGLPPSGNGACYQIGDSRGWLETHSAEITTTVNGTSGWKQVEAVYTTLVDTTKLQIVARRLAGTGPVTGTAWYKNVTVTRIIRKCLPAVPVLTVSASRNASKTKLFLIITNKDLKSEVLTELAIPGYKAGASQAWTLTGPSAEATNEIQPNSVGVRKLSVQNGILNLPPCSLTAVEVEVSAVRKR